MDLPLLGAILGILGIRGNISQYDALGSARTEGVLRVGIVALLRVVAILIAMVASLSLLLWTAVWLAIKLL